MLQQMCIGSTISQVGGRSCFYMGEQSSDVQPDSQTLELEESDMNATRSNPFHNTILTCVMCNSWHH